MVDFYLPRKKDWEYYPAKETKTIPLSANEKYNLYPKKFPDLSSTIGWAFYAHAVFDHNDMGLHMKLVGVSREIEYEMSVAQLIALGYTVNTNCLWSPTPGVISFTPIFPGLPYQKLLVEVVNLGTASHNLLNWEIIVIPIKESE